MKHLLFLATGLAFAAFASAQETTGVNTTNTSGAVIKGKAPVAKSVLRVKVPKPSHFKLSNGVDVFALEDHRLPAIRLTLEIRAGQLYETKPGVAAATAALLTAGTPTRTAEQILADTEDRGSSIGAGSGLDSATVGMACLKESFVPTLDILRDCLLHSNFPETELARFRRSSRGGSAQSRTNPTGIASGLANRVFYGATPYGRSVPSPAELAKVTPADIAAFHGLYYRPNGAVLGVAGDFKLKDLRRDLEAALKDWTAGKSSKVPPAAVISSKTKPQVYLVDRPNSAQTVVYFGSLAVPASDTDFIALTVANRILGGGSSGRLFQNIRERKGYTYGAYSNLASNRWPSLWAATASVRTEVTQPAIAEFYAEFARLRDQPVSADELHRAQRAIVGGFARTLESSDEILSRTVELVRLGLPMDYWDKYPERVDAVTAEDVMRVARKYLDANGIQLVAVGDKSKIGDELKKFGGVEVVPAAKVDSYVSGG